MSVAGILLAARGLSKTWAGGSLAVRVEGLELAEGSTTVVTGDNGAGKTTLLRMLAGLLAPDPGASLVWRGEAVPAPRPGVDASYLHQQPYLFDRSVAANAAFPLRARGVADPAETDAVLKLAGLARKASQPASSLSGGEGRRLAVARVWATGAPLVLLDEPTANLDAAGVEAVEKMVSRMAEAGRTVVVAMHENSMSRALAAARRVRLGEQVT